ncbi:hypothetical protein BC940DRAFT_12844 [Gongronella butleri]|nr:hypothetical protein BC940DRAFT_12844 [Gongronella butleri]
MTSPPVSNCGAAFVSNVSFAAAAVDAEVESLVNTCEVVEELVEFLLAFFKDDPTRTLEEAKVALEAGFPPVTISLPALQTVLRETCGLTYKEVQISTDVIDTWRALQDLDILRTCVFLDIAGFNLDRFGWMKREATPMAQNVVILGAICEIGILKVREVTRNVSTVTLPVKRKIKATDSRRSFF